MEKNVKVINYKGEVFDTEMPYEDVAAIAVNIWSGDEMLTIFTKKGEVFQYDAADYHYYRSDSHYDGAYAIYPEDFEEWDQRSSPDPYAEGGYQYWEEDEDSAGN